MKKDNIVIIKQNEENIGEEAYRAIARALINAYGPEVCKLLVKTSNDTK